MSCPAIDPPPPSPPNTAIRTFPDQNETMLNLCRHPSCVLSVTGAAASASRSGSSKQLISALLGGSRGEEGPWGLGPSGAWGGGGAAGVGGSVDGDGEEGERVGWNGAMEMTLTGDKQRESFVQG